MAESFVLNTGARIPSVGLGVWQMQPDAAVNAIYAAVKAGYRHIDCAAAYNNEKEAFSPLGSPGSPGINGPSVLKNPIVVSVADKLQKTPAQVALRWGIQMGHSVLPKSANESRIKENIDILDWSIPEDLMAKFSEIKQVRLLRAEFAVHPQGGYNTLEDFWDGEI
ncbi:aldo-keto reductase family 4 member C10-like [Miscanthus floridulus]|uniref:aldo-keto reductase family 4 member C10-like n=1 Tax=Miscanthus floridulus TaxID=154761 RepID=UPI0034598C20